MKGQIEISVITVNFNGQKDTERLIESLYRNFTIPFELIVVDNGSKNDEAVALQYKYPFIKTIRSERNLGFAGGNNLGIKASSGKYLFFLNNDTFVLDNRLEGMVRVFEDHPEIGGISPKIMFADSGEGIQFAGYTLLSRVTLRNRLIGFHEPDHGQYNQARITPYLHGAAMLVRREAIEKVGLMPEEYFLYYEELDWSLQFRRNGYLLQYNPFATVYHSESRSTGRNSPLQVYYMTRNRLLFARKNLIGMNRLLSICYQLLIVSPKNIAKALLRGNISLAKAVVRGDKDFFKVQS